MKMKSGKNSYLSLIVAVCWDKELVQVYDE